MTTKSWVQHPTTGKLIPRDEYVRPSSKSAAVHVMQEFVSPITKEVISCPKQLRKHNKDHGVTNSADYSQEFMEKRSQERINESIGNTPEAKAERKAMLNYQLTKAGIR